MELPGKRKQGSPNRRYIDVVKEDMAEVYTTDEDNEDRNNRGWKIRCGDPYWEKPKEEEDEEDLSPHKAMQVLIHLIPNKTP